MRRPKSYSVKEVFESTMVGFTFEFYCSKGSNFISEDLSKILGKNVVVTDNDNIEPTFTSAILVKEYDGKRPRYQFKVGMQRFNDISAFLHTTLFWINENASLDHSTLVKTAIDYDFKELHTVTPISHMDVGMMVLKMNESYIYERFPEMKGSPYALSIKKLVPYNMSSNASNVVNIKNEFKMPTEPYYGINLSDQTRGNISFNYIGGPKYSEKPKELQEVLEYLVITTFQVLNSLEYTPSMVSELNRLSEEYRRFRKCYYDPLKFFEAYKDIKIYIDLNNNHRLIETQWFQIRDHIARLILESDVKKCRFNWDTEMGTFQIKDAVIKEARISGFHLVDSTISGVVENCHFWKTNIKNSRVFNSTFVNQNKIENSFLQKVRVDRNNRIDESFIVNFGEIINCDVNGSIIKNAGIGEKAKLDENCLVINPRERIYTPSSMGIEVKEVRDYKWIKSLRREDYKDQGFANEYKEE